MSAEAPPAVRAEAPPAVLAVWSGGESLVHFACTAAGRLQCVPRQCSGDCCAYREAVMPYIGQAMP